MASRPHPHQLQRRESRALRRRAARQASGNFQPTITPQEGPQTQFFASSADIVIYGGQAGGGKTWGLLVEPLRWCVPSQRYPMGVPGFFGVIFRRVQPQIRQEGGLWDESEQIYPEFDAHGRETVLEWEFPGGQTMRFASMQHEKDRKQWQGAQIPYIGFDELTHFTEEQFWYLLSRNRSTCGVRPYIRATCNPEADSWVADLIEWWIDQDETSPTYGLPIRGRSGVIRYFIRVNDRLVWAETPEALYEHIPEEVLKAGLDPRGMVKSLTFIQATVYDNKKLLEKNPEYLGNLLSLSRVEREQLLSGNWKVRATAGMVFNKDWWRFKDAAPAECTWVRAWDKAGTDKEETTDKSPYTASVLMGRYKNQFYLVEATEDQLSALKREELILKKAVADTEEVGRHTIWVEEEPGSGGKESADRTIQMLAGFHARKQRMSREGDKITRALPMSAQVEAGNVFLIGRPNEWAWFINRYHEFPQARVKDVVDAGTLAFNKLARRTRRQSGDYATVHG